MIKLPFNATTFAAEMKPKISGSNLTLNYYNLESTICRVAVELQDLLGKEVYEAIVDNSIAKDKTELSASARDYLQRSMLHLALYHHAIYLIANIGNDGITVKKSDSATTIYKYQQDELELRLISDGWFWFNRILLQLNDTPTLYPLWQMRVNELGLDDMRLIPEDFTRFVGVKDTYFVYAVLWIINEVWTTSASSRVAHAAGHPDIMYKLKRAACYEVVGLAVQRMAFFFLPENIRKDINNEQTKKNVREDDVKSRVAQIYLDRAAQYWMAIDAELSVPGESCPEHISAAVFKPGTITENDSFCV